MELWDLPLAGLDLVMASGPQSLASWLSMVVENPDGEFSKSKPAFPGARFAFARCHVTEQ
jgi:hypothetical protein